MIKANELRIGNYVMDGFTRTGRVLSFNEKTITIKLPFSVLKLNSHKDVDGLDVYPIPLTPELLEDACGLRWNEAVKAWEVPDSAFGVIENKNGLFYACKTGWTAIDHIYSRNIKSLHQLQNLHFALTGEELTIDENKLNRGLAS